MRLQRQAAKKIKIARAEWDEKPGQVLFVGSSTFTFWKHLKSDMEGVPCINVAFGGSKTMHVLQTVDQIVQFRPKVVVYYCGTNDISGGAMPEVPVENFKEFATNFRRKVPGVKIVYVSIILTPFQIYLRNKDKVAKANALVKEFANTFADQSVVFADINSDERFSSNLKWYLNDGLHLNNEGHTQLGQVLKPIVNQALASNGEAA